MGFLKQIERGIRKGVGHLTGAHAKRQKSKYNEAVGQYNREANEAQAQIDKLTQSLEAAKSNLHSFDEQRAMSRHKEYGLQGSISSYEHSLNNLERQKEAAANEAQGLQAVFKEFQNKAPQLAKKIEEVQQLPNEFNKLYEAVVQQKGKLQGLSPDEAGALIKKHKADVENLRKQREEMENKIRSTMSDITSEHHGLEYEKRSLEQRLQSYKNTQDRLLSETSFFESQKAQLQKAISDYKTETDKANAEYAKQQNLVTTQEKQLNDYINSAQGKLNELGHMVDFRAGKYKRDSRHTGLARGLALGAATFATGAGLGGFLGKGLQYAAPVLGIGTYLGGLAKGQKLTPFERLNLNEVMQNKTGLSGIDKLALGSPKIAIPELGGLKQSLAHFDMPTVPKLKDLPQLHETLGKITSLKDIEALGLGLPSLLSASGKKYSHGVLYNPDFIKKLRKVSKYAGIPYFSPKPHNMIGGLAYA